MDAQLAQQQPISQPYFEATAQSAKIVDLQAYLQSQPTSTAPHSKASSAQFALPQRWLLGAQGGGLILLTLASVLCEMMKQHWGAETLSQWHLWGLTQKFNFDSADSLPNFFQTTTMLLSTLWLWLITKVKQSGQDEFTNYWRVLTATFFLLALDETTNLHTMTAKPLRELLQASNFLYFTWVVWGIAFALLFVAAYYKFLRALPARMRNQLLWAGAIFLSGAVGMEMVGGQLHTVYGIESAIVAAAAILEEVLEMIGILLFNYALLNYLAAQTQMLPINLRQCQKETV